MLQRLLRVSWAAGNQTSWSWRKSTLNIHWKDWCWSWNFGHLMRRTDSGKDPDAGKDWRREKKGTTEDEIVGWHPTQWTWVWASSRSWWWTGRPGLLQSWGSQRVGHDWVTELNWTDALGSLLWERNLRACPSMGLWIDLGWKMEMENSCSWPGSFLLSKFGWIQWWACDGCLESFVWASCRD